MLNVDQWSLSPKEAIEKQKQWASQVSLTDHIEPVEYIAGVDVGFERKEDDPTSTWTRAAVVVIHYPSLTLVESLIKRIPTEMPYIPGLLSFRELPAIVEAFKEITIDPQLVMVDGHGIAHPRGLGIASHLGLYLDKPTIGIAKKRLYGDYVLPGDEIGDTSSLYKGDKVLGKVLRSRRGVKPVFVSPGHMISIESSVQWVEACLTGFKLPEPTRQADRLASRRTKALQQK